MPTVRDRPLGAHTSIAGGVAKAVARALAIGADALQIFTRNQVRWQSPPLAPNAVREFLEAFNGSGIRFLCAHSSYLINLASPDKDTRQKSCAALLEETRRAEELGCSCLVLHPGSPKKDDVTVGIERIVAGLEQVLAETADCSVRIALENTAGQGASLGAAFEELGSIAERVGNPERLGLCLDTAHAFAAGYDLREESVVNDLVSTIDANFGVDRLYLMHLNDSLSGVGNRVDRHANIGEGTIGVQGFRNLLRHPELQATPGIIETPKGNNSEEADARNLACLRELEEPKKKPPQSSK
ncbi:MAG: deoxyribonuclease IV [Lentisphaeria bacterium]